MFILGGDPGNLSAAVISGNLSDSSSESDSSSSDSDSSDEESEKKQLGLQRISNKTPKSWSNNFFDTEMLIKNSIFVLIYSAFDSN